MRRLILILMIAAAGTAAAARNVSISAYDRPASEVFRSLVEQTGKNFVYSSELLDGLNVTVVARNEPLKKVLRRMFAKTDIEFTIKGDNVLLKRRARNVVEPLSSHSPDLVETESPDLPEPEMLGEVVVVSRLEAPAVNTAEIGARKLTAGEIASVPVLFGEADVVKALQMQPGVSESSEGMAGMHVHGGGADENLYMLDNVPLYQVNHFAGLFSAFNVDAIRYIDFFKSSVPAKYDGRLSSFLDVRTINGSSDGHHGSAKLGLTSGAFNISGPIGDRTTYAVAMRRSWYEVLSVPFLALMNSASDDEKIRFRYAFMDLNAKINHRFSDRTAASLSIYFGNDELHTGDKSDGDNNTGFGSYYDEKYDFHWGNFVAQLGVVHSFSPSLTAEFTAAFTRYFSSLRKDESETMKFGEELLSFSRLKMTSHNNINDAIGRADFSWQSAGNNRLRFGAGYTFHSFLPIRYRSESTVDDVTVSAESTNGRYPGSELNAYAEDEWHPAEAVIVNAGLHASLFHIDGKTHGGLSPRLSLGWRINDSWAVKGAYTRTVQYVHQLTQSYLALPTDQWIPITGNFKPQTADKLSAGVYWQSADGNLSASVEGYWKRMRNLLEYRDEFYLQPPTEMWTNRLTSGRGTAKGLDFKIEKNAGRLSGHIAYSLAWSDRCFAEKNGGRPYPARFDNRHTINILVNWKINSKVALSAAWTGHSGNHFTLMPQSWEGPGFGSVYGTPEVPLKTAVNNYQLPFYHRLDLGLTVRNSRGFWNFGLYNAYCHMNAIAVRRGWKNTTMITPDGVASESRPIFQKVSLLPLIPSISYTWQF
ncbi:MAG: TonB-dependent receptor [Muribaculaceae bacterium]|nr:TonB-dependent receptor [Muribaculaceae bacterium]